MFNVNIVADSIMPMSHRATSMLVTFPRYILAEFNTHRMLTRNSASSRAIPFKRMVWMVWNEPFIPLKWMKDHKGMQGSSYFTNGYILSLLKSLWLTARTLAIVVAWILNKIGLTKQLVNRLLEPFMWHQALITATEWENFFALRDEDGADIHIRFIAHMMLEAMNKSIPKRLKPGEWHMPFGDDIDWDVIRSLQKTGLYPGLPNASDYKTQLLLSIATARCARTSYLTLGQDPVKHDYKKDIKQHDMLAAAGHWSPFEHCAKAMSEEEYDHNTILTNLTGANTPTENFGWCGNFRGFIQYRKTFPNENRTDSRLIKHTY